MPEQATEHGRGVPVMLPKDIPLPAFIRIVDQKHAIIQQYTPAALDDAQRAMYVQLIKAVKLSIFCFNAHWPSSVPLRHYQADVMERLNDAVARAEALIAEKVEDPPPPQLRE